MPVKDYNTDPDLNTTISGINIAEGCAPSGINNAIRQLMADVKEEFEGEDGAVSALRALIAEELEKKLSLSGGAMTGPITFGNFGRITWDSSKKMFHFQAFHDGVLGAQIAVRAYDAPELPGTIVIQPRKSDGSGGVAIIVYPDGKITTGSNTVLTSAGGNISSPLKSAAGTYAITSQVTNSLIRIFGGTSPGTGANLDLYGGDNEEKGKFVLRARTSSAYKVLEGVIGGNLTWGGSPVLTLVSSWKSGLNWYRKYSDGWIEQGGMGSSGQGTLTKNTTITLHTPFSTTNYFIGGVGFVIEGSGRQIVKTRTTTSFTTTSDGDSSGTNSWYACGY